MPTPNPFNHTERKLGSTSLEPYRTYTVPSKQDFYTAVPAQYRNYYNWFVRRWFEWYDGFVNGFHNNGNSTLFSTRIAYSIAHKFSKQITGGKLLFEDNGDNPEAKKEIMRVLRYKRFDSKLQQAFEWALAGGDSILKLDSYKRGEPSIQPLRKDEYFVDVDFDGNIIRFSGLVDNKTKTNLVAGNKEYANFFIMEERRYNKNDEPEYRLSIKRGTSNGVSYGKGNFHSADYKFTQLPNDIRDEFKKEFPNTNFNEWESMPLDDLGVYMIKATEGTSFQPSLPFGESIFSNMIHLLMSYDFYYTAKMTDMYLGKGKVLIPDHMKSPHETGSRPFSELNDMVYAKIPYVDPEQQTPTPVQFSLRSGDWTTIRNDLLQEMAMQLNLSPRTLASFAVPAAEKPTAHEINVDQDDTALTIEAIRKLNEGSINSVIDSICKYFGFEPDTITVKFSKMGLTNMSTMVNQMTTLKDRNLIDDRTALEYVFPDKTDDEIDKIIERKKEEAEEKIERDVKKQEKDEIGNKEKAMFDNQATHTPNPPEEETDGE